MLSLLLFFDNGMGANARTEAYLLNFARIVEQNSDYPVIASTPYTERKQAEPFGGMSCPNGYRRD